ncbi:STAS domain-containing protein [Anaerobranca gottschalkii]|uniref:Anti-sigma factor antagonist n=1 Tax=Anaerobranca gottschalkii DSM 13577 TaxID=1120990 RepID=A0A1H9Y144_9FIRM|nr:anti-sigma factor antagonist [Anaerobranca gottschalkii]SES62418.1 anti-anti-sigma regulatory factor, SpoIIAA [Anaerobranca gottschalkii DSM 13577]
MKVVVRYENKFMIASLVGELDHHTAVEVREVLQKEIQKEITTKVILDLKGLKFMDSSGVGVILGRYKELDKLGGKLVVTGLNDTVKKIFQISGLNKIIKVFDDIPQGMKFLKEGQ